MAKRDAGSSASGDAQLNLTVYDRIKTEILERRLRPGVKLTHQGIAELLGVSRTPVREALERLFQEGYVYRIPRRGFFVAEIGTDEVGHLYQTREALELYQLGKLLGTGIPKRDLARLRAINERYGKLISVNLTYERLMVDREFHVYLASLTGNTVLTGHLDAIFEKVILKRRLEGVADATGNVPFEDHTRLLNALEGGDRDAIEILGSHIRGACDRLLAHLQSFGDGGRAHVLSPNRRS